MEERTALADLIRRARRRLYLQLAAHALGDACAIFLGGATLALIAGTAILGLPFFVLLIVASSCFAGWRARAGIGSPYQTAQKLDRRLSLPDPLSTALYFSDHPARPEQAGIVSRQRKEAEQAARSADVAYAFPFAASRGLYASGALLFAATGLFFLRFGINHRLELNTPLVHLAFGSGATPAADPPAARKRLADRRALNIPGLPPIDSTGHLADAGPPWTAGRRRRAGMINQPDRLPGSIGTPATAEWPSRYQPAGMRSFVPRKLQRSTATFRRGS